MFTVKLFKVGRVWRAEMEGPQGPIAGSGRSAGEALYDLSNLISCNEGPEDYESTDEES